MFGSVVLEIPKDAFEHEFEWVKNERGAKSDTDLDESALRDVVDRFKRVAKNKAGRDFPQDPNEQLAMSRDAVFRSWMNPRAQEYRRIYDIPDHIGHRGERAADGLRQHGQPVRHRRRLHRNPATGPTSLCDS